MSVLKASPCTSSPKQLPTSDVQKSARHAHASSSCMARSRAASRATGHSVAGSSASRPVGTRNEKRRQSSTSSKGSASSYSAASPRLKTGRQPW